MDKTIMDYAEEFIKTRYLPGMLFDGKSLKEVAAEEVKRLSIKKVLSAEEKNTLYVWERVFSTQPINPSMKISPGLEKSPKESILDQAQFFIKTGKVVDPYFFINLYNEGKDLNRQSEEYKIVQRAWLKRKDLVKTILYRSKTKQAVKEALMEKLFYPEEKAERKSNSFIPPEKRSYARMKRNKNRNRSRRGCR